MKHAHCYDNVPTWNVKWFVSQAKQRQCADFAAAMGRPRQYTYAARCCMTVCNLYTCLSVHLPSVEIYFEIKYSNRNFHLLQNLGFHGDEDSSPGLLGSDTVTPWRCGCTAPQKHWCPTTSLHGVTPLNFPPRLKHWTPHLVAQKSAIVFT
jgi:hypothetical protein